MREVTGRPAEEVSGDKREQWQRGWRKGGQNQEPFRRQPSQDLLFERRWELQGRLSSATLVPLT